MVPEELEVGAALATGWPTLVVEGRTEARVLEARARVEAILGPLPQADEIEPTEPDEPWVLEIDLPGLDPAGWGRIREALAGFAPRLVPGVLPGRRAAEDAGRLGWDEIEAGGLVARLAYDAEDGAILPPDTEDAAPDDVVEALGAELLGAVRAVAPSLCAQTARGPDTVQPVVDRRSGRFGLSVSFPSDALDALEGEALVATREAVLGALAEVVAARASHPVARLAPDVVWDARFGLSFTLWFVAPSVAALPGDGVVEDGLTVAGLGGWDGLVEEAEVQVVGDTAAIGEVAGWLGGRPRWLRTSSGPAFAAIWRVVSEFDALPEQAAALAALPGVRAVRVVPGELAGATELWWRMDPAWHLAGPFTFVRLRDGLSDRDWLAPTAQRARDDRDDRVATALVVTLAGRSQLPRPLARDGRIGQPVRDEVLERDGLDLLFEGRFREGDGRLDALLAALARTRAPVATVVPLAFRPRGVLLRFWYRAGSE